MSRAIRKLAIECGFQKVGIVPAGALEEERRRLEEWLGLGYHGEMRWMERDPQMRSDPRRLFEGARSVVALAMNYYTPHEHSDDDEKGKISRYAWGDDYHDVLRGRMKELLGRIELLIPGVRGKICVDTSPVMDKAWAVRAGIGWLGKHTNVITTDYGSWVFLGEILLDVELDYDTARVEDHCGSCTACLDACPTDAITEPYVVNSNKCISYATIELRSDEIPDEISEKLEGWVYGCDICQDVCPWNRFQKNSDKKEFTPRGQSTGLDPEEILAMDDETYSRRFYKSAMKRVKLRLLKRNAAALLRSAR
ncbi:MAG: tRNA epoxyqueuosine(34) reductase QueG [Acidobacteriota bacterium]|nr:MAG: tRNA epoxyqueuosine(34) reductase QueG [Acidobacteriota bacterium]